MYEEPFLAQVRIKMKDYEHDLEIIDEEIAKLTTKRERIAAGHAAYRKILELETEPHENEAQSTLKLEVPNFTNLSIPAAAEAVLRESGRALSIPDLLREIKKRGKSMEGPNVYNVLYSTLKRSATTFKKQGSLWTLVNKKEAA